MDNSNKYGFLEPKKPDFDVHPDQRDAKWYGQAAMYFCQYWNNPFPNVPASQNGQINPWAFPVNTILDNWAYVLGVQNIGISSALLGGDDFEAAINLYRPGNEVWEIVKSKVGRFVEFIANLEPTADLHSANAKSRRLAKKEAILMALDYKFIFNTLAELGLIFDPLPPGIEIKTREQFERNQYMLLKERGQVYAEKIAKWQVDALELENLYRNLCIQTEVAGLSGIENRILGGRVSKDVIAGHCLIWDYTAQDDRFNKYGRFRGRVDYYMNVDDIIAQDGHLMPSDMLEYMKSVSAKANDINLGTFYNKYNYGGIGLWNMPTQENTSSGRFSRVRMYFKGPLDTRLKEKANGQIVSIQERDKNGNPITDAMKAPGDFVSEIWYQCTVVAGRYAYDFGPCPNQVYDPVNPLEPICPLVIVIPEVMLGQYRSSVARIKSIQSNKDFYEAKAKEKIIKDKGLNHVLDGTALGVGDAGDVEKDFQSIGFSVREIVREPGEPSQNAQITIDRRMDVQSTDFLMRAADREKKIMQENSSVPDASLGTAPAYIGKGVQEQKIGASNQSLADYYRALVLAIQKDLEVGVNMQKIAFYADGMEEAARMVIGEDGLNFIKLTPEYSLEMLGISLRIDDRITPEDRERLIQFAMAMGQNGAMGMNDWVKIKTLGTYTEMAAHFEAMEAKREKMQMEAQMDASNAAFEAKALAAQKSLEGKQIAAEAQVEGKEVTADAAKYAADVKAGTDLEVSQNQMVEKMAQASQNRQGKP
jgi:hypothetical protein